MKTFAKWLIILTLPGLILAQAPNKDTGNVLPSPMPPDTAVPAAPVSSPPAETSVTIAGKAISIKYSAPSVRKRQIFGPGGLISHDANYPVWRAGANDATAFHTDADLMIGNLSVPKGDYTIYALVADPDNWQLIINRQTGQWGLTYDENLDLGRVKMTMSKPPAPVEVYKMTLSATGPKSGKLQMAWEKHIASVAFMLK